MASDKYDFVFKILLIGNSSVGKSSLLLRFSDNIFHQTFLPTIGVDFKIRTIEQAGSIIKLQMWDTAGQEKFRTITSAYYKGSQGIVLVFDLTDRKSFDDIKNWLCQAQKYSHKDAVKILVGNKCDMNGQRQVSSEECEIFARNENMIYYQSSAKQNRNVQNIFTGLSASMKQAFSKQNVEKYNKTTTPLQPIKIEGKIKNKTCC